MEFALVNILLNKFFVCMNLSEYPGALTLLGTFCFANDKLRNKARAPLTID